MAALQLKHLLNHDEESDEGQAHYPILPWDGDAFLEEYVRHPGYTPRGLC
jgi:hypothetical protein